MFVHSPDGAGRTRAEFMWLKFRGIMSLARIFPQNPALEQLTGKIMMSNNLAGWSHWFQLEPVM